VVAAAAAAAHDGLWWQQISNKPAAGSCAFSIEIVVQIDPRYTA